MNHPVDALQQQLTAHQCIGHLHRAEQHGREDGGETRDEQRGPPPPPATARQDAIRT